MKGIISKIMLTLLFLGFVSFLTEISLEDVYSISNQTNASIVSDYENVTTHEGDLIIDGAKTFVVENCTYIQNGDIYIRDSARLLINDAVFMIAMQSDYDYNIRVEYNGTIDVDNSTVKPSENWRSQVRLLDSSRLNVNNAKLERLAFYSMENSYSIVENSILKEIEFGNLNISLHEIVFSGYLGIVGSNLYLYGNVSIDRSSFGPIAFYESNVTRNYNIITKATSNDPAGNVELTLLDENDTTVWNGVTDNLGEANFDLMFADNNKTDGLKLEAVKGSYYATVDFWLFSETPIVMIMKYFADLNADGKVNIQDITIVAIAYQSKLGDPNWNELADLDKNGIVNILDISMVAKDYGKTV